MGLLLSLTFFNEKYIRKIPLIFNTEQFRALLSFRKSDNDIIHGLRTHDIVKRRDSTVGFFPVGILGLPKEPKDPIPYPFTPNSLKNKIWS